MCNNKTFNMEDDEPNLTSWIIEETLDEEYETYTIQVEIYIFYHIVDHMFTQKKKTLMILTKKESERQCQR